MSPGYLCTIAVAATGTILALTAPRRPRVLARAAALTGPVFNEVPLLVAVVLVASTALAAADGDIESAGAWVAVGVVALTLVGLAVVAARGLRSRPAVEEALADALGFARRDARTPDAPGGGRRSSRFPLWPFAWFPRPREVERVANIPYGDAGRRNRLDLYRHRSRPARAPALVYVHGGGFSGGRKTLEARALLHRLARQGWVCVSANYRLRPQATFPDHLVDLKRVIAWTRAAGAEYGIDPRTVFVAGSSAGGHMAAMAALTQNEPALQPGFEEADTSLAAAISLYGYLGSYYGMDAVSSPRSYVRDDAPPFFLAQGARDTYSPRFLAIARGFVGDLRSVSANPVVYAEIPWGQHGFDLFRSPRFEAVIDGIDAFAAWVRANRDGARSGAPAA